MGCNRSDIQCVWIVGTKFPQMGSSIYYSQLELHNLIHYISKAWKGPLRNCFLYLWERLRRKGQWKNNFLQRTISLQEGVLLTCWLLPSVVARYSCGFTFSCHKCISISVYRFFQRKPKLGRKYCSKDHLLQKQIAS